MVLNQFKYSSAGGKKLSSEKIKGKLFKFKQLDSAPEKGTYVNAYFGEKFAATGKTKSAAINYIKRLSEKAFNRLF